MNRSSRKRALRKVGVSSAIAFTVLASAAGVASASTHASRFANAPAARSSKDAGTNAPPMPPGGPGGIGGDVKVLTSTATTYSKSGESASLRDVRVGSFVFAGGTFGSLPPTIDAATVGIGMPGPGNGPGPNNGSGPVGAGPFARGPPGILVEPRSNARGRNQLEIA